MERGLILLDTSILIDFFRKKKKEKAPLYRLVQENHVFAISVITEYEIFTGSTALQEVFWKDFFKEVTVLSFDSFVNEKAVRIYKELKAGNKLIEIPDILIGATALHYNLPIATLNKKHFERIKGLKLID